MPRQREGSHRGLRVHQEIFLTLSGLDLYRLTGRPRFGRVALESGCCPNYLFCWHINHFLFLCALGEALWQIASFLMYMVGGEGKLVKEVFVNFCANDKSGSWFMARVQSLDTRVEGRERLLGSKE